MPDRKPRSDGVRSRAAILQAATALASVQGLEVLSIGGVAGRLGMSKSGVFAHFGSKEDLQLAAVDAASVVFEREVLAAAAAAPDGVARLIALTEGYLSYLQRAVFPGGCFFAAAVADHDALGGAVREAVSKAMERFASALEAAAAAARERQEIPPEADPRQIGFEIAAMLAAANSRFQQARDPALMTRARAGIESVILRG